MPRSDDDRDAVEWLDVEPVPLRAAVSSGVRRRPRWLFLVAGLVLAALVVVGAVGAGRHRSHQALPPASSTLGLRTSWSSVSWSSSAVPVRPLPLVTVTTLGRPLLPGERTTWQIFARSATSDVIAQIDVRTGRVIQTSHAALDTNDDVSFVVGEDRVLVHPVDAISGYQVTGKHRTGPMAESLNVGGALFPGPRADEVWASLRAGSAAFSLRTLDGHLVGNSLQLLPEGVTAGQVSSDGAGGLVFDGIGGVYQLDERRPPHRLSTGSLIATGRTELLAQECDAAYRCPVVVRNHSGVVRRVFPLAMSAYRPLPGGLISPDGQTAAVLGVAAPGRPAELHLFDLHSGQDRRTSVSLAGSGFATGMFAWAPDSRWLIVNDNGKITAVNPQTGQLRRLDVRLPTIAQIVIGNSGSG